MSVRDLAEARAALQGGAAIIDVKEPSRGSLGRADAHIVQQIVKGVRDESPDTPVSAALGEVTDFNVADKSPLPGRLSFAKLGLSGLRRQPGWIDQWLNVRRAVENQPSGIPPQWVAVAYADAEQADAPPIAEVLEAAVQTGCAGFLIDSFHKSAGGLLDLIPSALLTEVSAQARRHGLFFAVAGRLRMEDVPKTRPFNPDVIAVRSAACEGSDRQAGVCAERVRRLRRAITDAAGIETAPSSQSALQPVDNRRDVGS